MESGDEYVDKFLVYLKDFVANIRSDDPLPVRAPNYKVTESEIDGQIIDIVHHYLNNKECPPYVRSLVAQRVWSSLRNLEVSQNGCDVIDHGNHIYEPMKLIQDVTSRTNEIIKDLYTTISRDGISALPKYLPVSHYAIKNIRRKMEDRHVILQDLNTLYNINMGFPHAFYAVFDGHAGSDAAVYSAAHLHQYLIQNPLYESDPMAALKHAFHITDTNFTKKSEKERLKGGTTAVVALVREKRLVVAWLGDSQALLVRQRVPVPVVQPHKPELQTEMQRIDKLGGCVLNIQGTWRVLGQLAVSRAIGDVQYKPFISSECDIKSLEINGDEDFLILACDGLWDMVDPERAVNIVYSYLSMHDGDTDGVGRCLIEAARSAGSEDNITAVVVFLRPVASLMEEEAARRALGQVPDLDYAVDNCKDKPPSSINSLFCPPESGSSDSFLWTKSEGSAFVPTNTDLKVDSQLLDNPLSESVAVDGSPSNGETVGENLKVTSDAVEYGTVHLEGASAVDEDYIGEDQYVHSGPTAEEVDAALAELDSIPDGACEADVDDVDEEEEEEEWSYFRMEPQKTNEPEEPMELGSNPFVVSQELLGFTELGSCEDWQGIPVPLSGSPKSVEGYITSVELNAPEESYNTTLSVNQLNGAPLEKPSGPFSVYVSSSPEPGSLDNSPLQVPKELPLDDQRSLMESDGHTPPSCMLETAVEIVHAQSTVEVVTPPVEEDQPHAISNIPDIMTQSFIGELPLEAESYTGMPVEYTGLVEVNRVDTDWSDEQKNIACESLSEDTVCPLVSDDEDMKDYSHLILGEHNHVLNRIDMIESEAGVNADMIESEAGVNADMIESEAGVNADMIESEAGVNADMIESEVVVNADMIESEARVNADVKVCQLDSEAEPQKEVGIVDVEEHLLESSAAALQSEQPDILESEVIENSQDVVEKANSVSVTTESTPSTEPISSPTVEKPQESSPSPVPENTTSQPLPEAREAASATGSVSSPTQKAAAPKAGRTTAKSTEKKLKGQSRAPATTKPVPSRGTLLQSSAHSKSVAADAVKTASVAPKPRSVAPKPGVGRITSTVSKSAAAAPPRTGPSRTAAGTVATKTATRRVGPAAPGRPSVPIGSVQSPDASKANLSVSKTSSISSTHQGSPAVRSATGVRAKGGTQPSPVHPTRRVTSATTRNTASVSQKPSASSHSATSSGAKDTKATTSTARVHPTRPSATQVAKTKPVRTTPLPKAPGKRDEKMLPAIRPSTEASRQSGSHRGGAASEQNMKAAARSARVSGKVATTASSEGPVDNEAAEVVQNPDVPKCEDQQAEDQLEKESTIEVLVNGDHEGSFGTDH